MRYILEVNTKKKEKFLADFVADNDIEVITQYEPLEKISKEVEKLGVALREANKNAGSKEVLNYYLRGRGISQGVINAVMGPLKDFFNNLGIDVEEM